MSVHISIYFSHVNLYEKLLLLCTLQFNYDLTSSLKVCIISLLIVQILTKDKQFKTIIKFN